MGLWEFLRQWQGSRHATGITLSVLVHAVLLAALLTNNPFFALSKARIKPGDALIVDLRSDPSPAAPGDPSPPAAAAPPQAPAPRSRTAARPPSPSVKPAPPTPAPATPAPPTPAPAPASPAPPQETPARVASTPPAPPAPQPPAPPVTDAAGTVPVPATPTPSAAPAPAAPSATATRSSEPPASSSAPAPRADQQVASAPPAANAPSGQAYVPDVRALRPGAGGTFGATGAGRGGIEGDPVALDNSDPRYGDYLARVKLAIERKMIYPCVKDPHGRICDYKQTQLVIEFGIKTDGNLAFVELRRAAAYEIYDEASMNAIKLATFPPMPETLRRIHPTGLPIAVNFRYITTLSLQSIIR